MLVASTPLMPPTFITDVQYRSSLPWTLAVTFSKEQGHKPVIDDLVSQLEAAGHSDLTYDEHTAPHYIPSRGERRFVSIRRRESAEGYVARVDMPPEGGRAYIQTLLALDSGEFLGVYAARLSELLTSSGTDQQEP